jgi:transcriptional regulator with XRE-family HTH domain
MENDPDIQYVIDQLQAALETSGLTQAAFARALGTSPSRFSTYMTGKTSPSGTFIARAIRIGKALARARETRTPASLSFAAAIQRALAKGDEHWALSMSLEARDRLRDTLERQPDVADAWSAQPHTGSDRWDTFLAALVTHEFETAHRRAPHWTEGKFLQRQWIIGGGRRDPRDIEAQTPSWLAERGIAITERDLATA